jgi:hypothetical protein
MGPDHSDMPASRRNAESIVADPAAVDALFEAHQQDIYKRTDRMFARLMLVQWLAGIAFSLWITPLAWAGESSTTHVHVWAAVFLGGVGGRRRLPEPRCALAPENLATDF